MKSRLVFSTLFVCAAVAPALAVAQNETSQSSPPSPIPTPIVYRNTEYGFCFWLPQDWKGYRIVVDKWAGAVPGIEDPAKMVHGPEILIRNSAWRADDPWQDIPIMVFTRAQWRAKEKNGLILSAAGTDWGPWGSNARYVFKQPDRWIGYAEPKGWREVESLMMTHPFQASCGHRPSPAATMPGVKPSNPE